MTDRLVFESDSGVFECDGNGLLLCFSAARGNRPDYLSSPVLRHLHIPEGVRRIGYEDPFGQDRKLITEFREKGVIGEITFPSTLSAIGACAFSGNVILNLTIPPTLLRMSAGAFMSCYIHTLTIRAREITVQWAGKADPCPGKLSIGGRNFKQTTIERLTVLPPERPVPGGWLKDLFRETEIIETVYP